MPRRRRRRSAAPRRGSSACQISSDIVDRNLPIEGYRRRLRRGTAAPLPGPSPTAVPGPLWLDLPWFPGAGEEEGSDGISQEFGKGGPKMALEMVPARARKALLGRLRLILEPFWRDLGSQGAARQGRNHPRAAILTEFCENLPGSAENFFQNRTGRRSGRPLGAFQANFGAIWRDLGDQEGGKTGPRPPRSRQMRNT